MSGPIHRDPRLIPLSHDHHAALARAREATLAVDGSVPHDAAALVAVAERCAAYFADELDAHFRREEKHLLPVSLARFGREDDLAARVRDDHAMVRKLTGRLTDPRDEAPMNGRLAAWAKALSDHIRFEEREWFEALQNSLPEAELERLGRLLAVPEAPAKPRRKAGAKKAGAKKAGAGKAAKKAAPGQPTARRKAGKAGGTAGRKKAGRP